MRPFIKSVSPDDPVVKPIMDTFGFDGYGRFIAVLDFCRNFGIETLDLELIIKQTRSNKRGAAKLLPLFQECLTNVLKKFGESFENVSENNSQTLPKVSANNPESFPKLEGQNPHGSIRNQEENREEEKRKEENEPPAQAANFVDDQPAPPPQAEPSEFFEWATKGAEYIIGLNLPNLMNLNGVRPWLEHQFAKLKTDKPNLKPDEILTAWMAACDAGAQKGVSSLQWIKTAFQGKAYNFEQERPHAKASLPAPKMTRWQILIDSERIQNIEHPTDVRRGKDYYFGVVSTTDEEGSTRGVQALINKHDPDDWIHPEQYKPIGSK